MANIHAYIHTCIHTCIQVAIRQARSIMDFGPVVKPLGITVKKEVGKVVETSDVVKPHATREFRKRGKSTKRTQKGGQQIFEFQNFEFQNFETFQNFVAWCLRRCWFLFHILAVKCSRAQREVYTVTAGRQVTLRGLGHVMMRKFTRT